MYDLMCYQKRSSILLDRLLQLEKKNAKMFLLKITKSLGNLWLITAIYINIMFIKHSIKALKLCIACCIGHRYSVFFIFIKFIQFSEFEQAFRWKKYFPFYLIVHFILGFWSNYNNNTHGKKCQRNSTKYPNSLKANISTWNF